MSNVAYKSAEQVSLENHGFPLFPCVVEVSEPDITWGTYTASSSRVGGATAWTYHRDQTAGRDGSPGGVDCTVRIYPVAPPISLRGDHP